MFSQETLPDAGTNPGRSPLFAPKNCQLGGEDCSKLKRAHRKSLRTGGSMSMRVTAP